MRVVHRRPIAHWLCERLPRYASLVYTSGTRACRMGMLQRAWEEQGIAWSTATAREATAAQARACDLSVAPDDALPMLIDIDTVEVLRRVVLQAVRWQGRWHGLHVRPVVL